MQHQFVSDFDFSYRPYKQAFLPHLFQEPTATLLEDSEDANSYMLTCECGCTVSNHFVPPVKKTWIWLCASCREEWDVDTQNGLITLTRHDF